MANRLSWICLIALGAVLCAAPAFAQETTPEETTPEEQPATESSDATEAEPAPVEEAAEPAEPSEPQPEPEPNPAWNWYELGAKSFKAKRYGEAAIAFDAAYRLDPTPTLLFNAARSYQLGGQLVAARARYQSLIQAEGVDPVTRRKSANAMAQLDATLLEREVARGTVDDDEVARAAAAEEEAKRKVASQALEERLQGLVAALPVRESGAGPFEPAAVDVDREAKALKRRGLQAYHAADYQKAATAFDDWAGLTDAPEAHRARLRVALRQGDLTKVDGLLGRLAERQDLPDWMAAELPYLLERAAVERELEGLRASHAEKAAELQALGEAQADPELNATQRAGLIAQEKRAVASLRAVTMELHARAVAARDGAARAQDVLKKAGALALEEGKRAASLRLTEGQLDAELDETGASDTVARERRNLLDHVAAAEAALDAARASGNAPAIEAATATLEAAESALATADEAADGESEAFSIFDKVLIQLNWGDDNLLIGAGETRESSPDPNFGRCSRTSIDGITGRDCAEGQSRLGLYKNVDVGSGFAVSGALVLGLGVVTDPESSKAGSVSLYDLGSYLKLDKRFGDSQAHLFVEMYPVDARPLSAGFHHDIEWGTKDEFPKNFRRGAAPGVKLGFDTGAFYAYVGAKTALIKSPLEVELESDIGNRILFSTRTFYGVLGGLGLHLDDLGLSIEANGGFFHKGTLTKEGVLGKDLLAGGGSARVGYHMGMPIGLRVDSSLYERSASGARTVEQPSYEGAFAFSTAIEGTMRVQNLSDFERPGSTALEWAYAGHLGFQARFDALRLHVEARARTLSYITAEVPGFFPYSTTPSTAQTSPELQGLVSVDYKLGDFTIALTGGVRMPATYRGLPPQGSGTDAASSGVRTVVVSEADAGGWYILNAGRKASPVGWGEVGLRWSPAREFSLMAEVLYGRDDNRTQVERDALGHALRVHTEPNILGLNLLGQFLF